MFSVSNTSSSRDEGRELGGKSLSPRENGTRLPEGPSRNSSSLCKMGPFSNAGDGPGRRLNSPHEPLLSPSFPPDPPLSFTRFFSLVSNTFSWLSFSFLHGFCPFVLSADSWFHICLLAASMPSRTRWNQGRIAGEKKRMNVTLNQIYSFHLCVLGGQLLTT